MPGLRLRLRSATVALRCSCGPLRRGPQEHVLRENLIAASIPSRVPNPASPRRTCRDQSFDFLPPAGCSRPLPDLEPHDSKIRSTRRSFPNNRPVLVTATWGPLLESVGQIAEPDWRTSTCTSLTSRLPRVRMEARRKGRIVESARSRGCGRHGIGASRERLASSTCTPCARKTYLVLDTVGPLMEDPVLTIG